ncbi:MAG: hypothetical protein R2711_03615 [Acidimicrobiales bacterium]
MRDRGPGRLFGTAREFLERMGLDRIEDLPDIAALFPSAEVMEALEQTLRQRPAEPEQPTLAVDGPARPAGRGGGADRPDEIRAIDEAPAPEPPSWAGRHRRHRRRWRGGSPPEPDGRGQAAPEGPRPRRPRQPPRMRADRRRARAGERRDRRAGSAGAAGGGPRRGSTERPSASVPTSSTTCSTSPPAW